MSKENLTDSNVTQPDFVEINLTDCDVPINCPFGIDPDEDLFPNHHA